LRSPLTALKLQLRSLEKADSDHERRMALTHLHDGVDRASRLIEQLLTAARTEPGEGPVSFAPVDLPETVRRIIADIFPMAMERGTDIALDAPEHLSINADSNQLPILIRNLVDNAVRYTPSNGKICITITAEQDRALLVVEDSGPGIPKSERGEVFRRFYRGQTGTGSGSGLGLSIIRNIAERHRASIELGDATLGGLRVEIGFPLHR
jgi:signal transduction histidine kinase